MPPYLDIYGLTKHRDAATLDRFLNTYVDRAKSEDRGDEELLMERLPPVPPGTGDDAFEWEPALTLSHTIERGLAFPRRAFTVYLAAKQADQPSVVLSFTADDQLILGLAIDDEGAKPENERRARELLTQLVEEYACHMGLILVEEHPPRSEAAFYARAKEPLAVFFGTYPENLSTWCILSTPFRVLFPNFQTSAAVNSRVGIAQMTRWAFCRALMKLEAFCWVVGGLNMCEGKVSLTRSIS